MEHPSVLIYILICSIIMLVVTSNTILQRAFFASAVALSFAGIYWLIYPPIMQGLYQNFSDTKIANVFMFAITLQTLITVLLRYLFDERGLVLFLQSDVNLKRSYLYTHVMVCVLFTVFSHTAFIYFNGLPPLLSVDLNSIGNNSKVLARSEFLESASYLWIFQIAFYVVPLYMYCILYFINFRNQFLKVAIYSIFFIYSAISYFSFLHKSPVVLFITTICLINILMARRHALLLATKYSIITVTAIVGMYAVFMWGYEIEAYKSLPEQIIFRIFGSYPYTTATAISYYLENPKEYGAAISINPFGILKIEMINLAKNVHFDMYGFIGNAPPNWFGYAYANFGFAGVLAESVLVACFMIFILSLLNYVDAPLLKLFFIMFFIQRIVFLNMSSSFEVIFNPSIVITLFVILLVFHLANFIHYLVAR